MRNVQEDPCEPIAYPCGGPVGKGVFNLFALAPLSLHRTVNLLSQLGKLASVADSCDSFIIHQGSRECITHNAAHKPFSVLPHLQRTAMRGVLVAVVLTLVCGVSSDEDEAARLLASKNILNQYVVEGKDLTVLYNIYNVGSSPAIDVNLVDSSFPTTDFEVVQGSLKTHWDRLSAGGNVTHAVILRPLKSGYFNFTSADLMYKATENAEKPNHGYTSAPGEGAIVSLKDFERTFSPHVVDWGVFLLMTLPSLGLPLLLWYGSMSKYTAKAKKS